MKKSASLFAVFFALVFSCFVAPAAFAATETAWNYQAFNDKGDRTGIGYITLKEDGATARLRISAGNMSLCSRADLEATVVRTPTTVTITTKPLVQGCDTVRFVLKADGTGGTRETLSGETWTADGKDRILTIRN